MKKKTARFTFTTDSKRNSACDGRNSWPQATAPRDIYWVAESAGLLITFSSTNQHLGMHEKCLRGRVSRKSHRSALVNTPRHRLDDHLMKGNEADGNEARWAVYTTVKYKLVPRVLVVFFVLRVLVHQLVFPVGSKKAHVNTQKEEHEETRKYRRGKKTVLRLFFLLSESEKQLHVSRAVAKKRDRGLHVLPHSTLPPTIFRHKKEEENAWRHKATMGLLSRQARCVEMFDMAPRGSTKKKHIHSKEEKKNKWREQIDEYTKPSSREKGRRVPFQRDDLEA